MSAEGSRSDTTLYPWNEALWSRLARDWAALPHALLLVGPRGLGKHAFGGRLAHALLCAQPKPDGACGACKSCQLLSAGNHPDFLALAPLEDARQIVVDQVRELITFLATKPHTAARKLVLIAPAEALNNNAANALLKVLEEPPAGNHLLLITAAPERLPATVRSRCPRLEFRPPAPAVAAAWLQQALPGADGDPAAVLKAHAHAPLAARDALVGGEPGQRQALFAAMDALAAGRADPLTLAGQWKKQASEVFRFMQTLAADLIRMQQAPTATYLPTGVPPSQLQALNQRLHLRELFEFFEVVSRNRRLCAQSLDEQLLLEEALLHWTTRVVVNRRAT